MGNSPSAEQPLQKKNRHRSGKGRANNDDEEARKPLIMTNEDGEAIQSGKDSSESQLELSEWDEERLVYDLEQLEKINDMRRNKEAIPIVRRNPYQTKGIRAHPELGPVKCLKSLIYPNSNEFAISWLYIVFAIYFWIQCIFIMNKYKEQYDFNNDYDWLYMFIATFSIALSLTATAGYIIFYSISVEAEKEFENYSNQGMLVLIYGCTICYILSEFATHIHLLYFILLVGICLTTTLILSTYQIPRWVNLAITGALLAFVVIFDLATFANNKTFRVFYIPLLIECIALGVGVTLAIFYIPENWYDNRIVQLYLNSFLLYSIIFVSFVFELHSILYYTLLNNSGNLKDPDEWWKVRNIFN